MRPRTVVWIAILSLVACVPTAAQTISGSISGSVVDAQGAAVAGAKVTAKNVEQATPTTTATDSVGHFVFPQLPPAVYTLLVEAPGFKSFEERNVVLNANTNISVGNIKLEVGAVSQTVEVVAQAGQLEADTAEHGTTIVDTQLQNIEVNGRSYLALLRLVPGTLTDRDYSLNTNEIGNVYSNGSRGNQQNITLSGVSNADYGANGRMMATVSLDAVKEFTVKTSNYEAQYGKSSGAQISVVVKNGTPNFHGSTYWYYRDKGMTANNWINNRDALTNSNHLPTPKPRYHYNYLGYSVGGPIYIPGKFNTIKDKLFFFWSEEYQRQVKPGDLANNPTIFHDTVPTALERQGDFSQSVNSSGQPFNLIKDPLSSNPCNTTDQSGCFQDGGILGKIPPNRLYGPGIKLLNFFPLSNTQGNGFNYQFQPILSIPRHEQVLRIDYHLNPKWQLYGSFINNPQDVSSVNGGASGFSLAPNFQVTTVSFYHPGYLYNLHLTTTVNPTIINEAQFGVSHHPVTILPDNPAAITRAGTGIDLPTLYTPYGGWIPFFSFGGTRIGNSPSLRYAGGGAYTPFYSHNAIIEATDNLSIVHKTHLFKTGIFVHRNRKDQNVYAQTEGSYNWGDGGGNPFDTGFGFANAAVGVFQSFSQATQSANGQYRFTNLEFYGQDTWRATRRLTLIYGVRAVWAQHEFDKDLQLSNFFPDRWVASQAPQLYWPCLDASNVRRACIGRGDNAGPGGTSTNVARDSGGTPLNTVVIGNIIPNTGNLTNGILKAGNGISKYLREGPGLRFGPRLGLTFDLTGNGNLIFRAGGGRAFDRLDGNEIFNLLGNPPTIFQRTIFNGFAQDLTTAAQFAAPPSLTAIAFKGDIPETYSFSAGLQAKLPWATRVDVAYVGAMARHLQDNVQLNVIPDGYGALFLPQNQDPTKVRANPTAKLGSNAYDSNFLRLYQGYGSITLEEFGATSNYNSLQTSVNRSVTKDLFLGVAYTWSKCLETGSGHRIDSLTRLANYGPCQFDIRNNFVFNYVYQIPGVSHLGPFNNVVTRAAFNGWQLSGLTQIRTGGRFSPGFGINGYDNNINITGTPDGGPRVALIGDPLQGTTDSPYNRLNPAAFAPASVGSKGLESGVNYLTTPGVSNWDMSLQKNVYLKRERSGAHFEFRVDAFNVFNHTQFSGINGSIQFNGPTDPNCPLCPNNLPYDATGKLVRTNGFGTVNGVRSPRALQTVIRFKF